MIDAHNHLNDTRLLPQVDILLTRMTEANVNGALVVGCDLLSSQLAVDLAAQYPHLLRAAIGVHPHESKKLDADTITKLKSLARHPLVVAIGEIGLDYYYDISPRDIQQEAFRQQLALAIDIALPIIIHERNASDDVVRIMDEMHGWTLGGTWHCCSTSLERARDISHYLYLGIAGWLTFKNSDNIRDIARAVPLERLLLETDAPYLTPVPFRGHANEPSFLQFTMQALAELKGVSPELVEKVTVKNTHQAFPLWGDNG